jgi:hypothetical protein
MKYPVNIHYFDVIDSYSKAYILGFIAADGALVKGTSTSSITLTITVKYEDRAVLYFIKNQLQDNRKLLEIERRSSFDNTKEIHHIRYAVSKKLLINSIMKYGIHMNKSLSMGNILENIPIEYRNAFIIGYFDGDGSVTVSEGEKPNDRGYLCKNHSLYISIRGTQSFLEGICTHLSIDKSHIKQYDSIPRLAFANKENVVHFFKCYNNLTFYYKRKYDKFLLRINHPSYDKYK